MTADAGDGARLLQELADREEIRDVLHRFCRGVDRADPELIASCFHPDGWDDHGNIRGVGSEVAVTLTESVREYWESTWHGLAQCAIELSGDTASVESYVQSFNQRTGRNGVVTAAFIGRYMDRFERRDGRWLIAHRTVVFDLGFAERLGAYKGDMSVFTRGRRDRQDVAYTGPRPSAAEPVD